VRQGGTGFDIAVPSQTYVPIWIKEGLVQETDPGKMENFKNVAPEWANPDFDPGRKYSVPWALAPSASSSNTMPTGAADSWGIIFNTPDELKGKSMSFPR